MLDDEELSAIARTTIGHYDANSENFWQGTKDHDVRQNVDALLAALAASGVAPPYRILDFGCGPGRDLQALASLGHAPTGLDGSPAFVAMARAHSGRPVLHQDFLHLDLPAASFDGVFANASLFHVPSQELPRVLRQLAHSLVPGGALVCSNPRGGGREGWSGNRYGTYLELEQWAALLESAGLAVEGHYYRPSDAPPAEQRWVVLVARRPAEEMR